MSYVGIGRRLVAAIVDSIVIGIIFYLIAILTGQTTQGGFALQGVPALLGFLLALAYYVLLEGTVGATLGKLALGVRVVKADGSRCDLVASLIRNVMRIIDWLPFLYIVGMASIAASPLKQRLGDRLAKTAVVRVKAPVPAAGWRPRAGYRPLNLTAGRRPALSGCRKDRRGQPAAFTPLPARCTCTTPPGAAPAVGA